MGQSQSPVHPIFSPPFAIHVCSLQFCLYLCFANRFIDGEKILDYLGGPNIITGVLLRRETGVLEGQSQGCSDAGFDDGGRDCQLRTADRLKILERQGNRVLPRASKR